MNKQILGYIFVLIILGLLLAIMWNTPIMQKPGKQIPTSPTSLPVTIPTDQSSGNVVVPMSIVTFRENASSSPAISYEYPQFSTLPRDFNDSIASSTLSRVAEFRSEVADNYVARNATELHGEAAIPLSAYTFISSWQPAAVNDRYVSIIVRYDSYTGGANGNQDLQTFNYDVTNDHVVTLQELFSKRADYLQYISDTVRQELRRSLTDASPGYVPGQMLLDGTTPTLANFSNFTFTNDTVTFYFPKYAIAPGAFGEQRVTISR